MKKKFLIINPTPMKKIKRLKKRKVHKNKKRVSRRKRVLRKNPLINKKGISTMRRKRKTRRTRRNPGTKYIFKNRKRYTSRRRSRRRLFKNPIDAMTGARTTDLLVQAAGAAGGGLAVPWLGNVFQLEGMTKYAAQVIAAIVGYYGLNKLGMRKAALPFAAGAVAVTAYQFAQDKGILAGLGSDYLSPADTSFLSSMPQQIGAVAYDQPGLSAVAYGQPGIGAIPLNQGLNGGGGFDDDTANADYYN